MMGDRRKVLIVEDNGPLRNAIRESLHLMGFETVEAGDGETARNRLAEHCPDLVCLDLVLPESSGYEICDFIRASDKHRKVPVLVMSERAAPHDRAHAWDAGADDFLPKPFSRAQLKSRIEALLAKAATGL